MSNRPSSEKEVEKLMKNFVKGKPHMKLVTIKSYASFNSKPHDITGKLVEILIGDQLHEFVIRTDGQFNTLIHYPSGGPAVSRLKKSTKKCATQAIDDLVKRFGADKMNELLNAIEVINT